MFKYEVLLKRLVTAILRIDVFANLLYPNVNETLPVLLPTEAAVNIAES